MQRLPGVESWEFIGQGRGHGGKFSAGYAYCECPSMADADETMALLKGFRVRGAKLHAAFYQPRNVSWAAYSTLKFNKKPDDTSVAAIPAHDHKMPSTGNIRSEDNAGVEHSVAEPIDSGKKGASSSGRSRSEDLSRKPGVAVKDQRKKEWTYKQPRTYEEVQKLLKTKLKLIPDVNEVLQNRVPLRVFDRDKWLAERRRMRMEEEQKARANAALARLRKTKRLMGPIKPPNKRLQLGYLRGRTKMGPNGELPF